MIRIRKADQADVLSILRVEQDCYTNPWSEASLALYVSDPERRIGWVVQEKGKKSPIIGYILLQFAADEAEICNIAVSPNHQKKGIGGLLLDAAIQFCAQKSICALHLEVRKENIAAIRLYEKKNFRCVGMRKAYYGTGEDALLYALNIA